MRRLLTICGALAACAIAFPTAAQSLPAIPFLTNYTYWDHHWLQWLPTHPRFEAIEAAVAVLPNGKGFIRVWLTERTPPKAQVHYFDDAERAGAMVGDSHFVPIRYAIAGEAGTPRGLDLAFRDTDGQAVSWFLKFAADKRLSSEFAGLKPSGGHGADQVFLLFVLGPNATTYDSRVMIGDKLHVVTPENIAGDKRYYGAAYTQGAHNFVFNYGATRVTRVGESFTTGWGGLRRFEPVAGAPGVLRSLPFGFADGNSIEIERAASDAITYRHRFGAHDTTMIMEQGRFAVSFDGGPSVMSGNYRHDSAGESFVWTAEQPGWARDTPLRTTATPTGDGYELKVGREARNF